MEAETYGVVPALLASAAVAGDYLCSCALEHPGVLDCAFDVREDAKLGCNRYGEVFVEGVDCNNARGMHVKQVE